MSKLIPISKPVNPQGRIDLLFAGLAEAFARRLETKFRLPGIWDTLKPVVDEKAREFEGMTPVELARSIGFLKPERKRRIKGAA